MRDKEGWEKKKKGEGRKEREVRERGEVGGREGGGGEGRKGKRWREEVAGMCKGWKKMRGGERRKYS